MANYTLNIQRGDNCIQYNGPVQINNYSQSETSRLPVCLICGETISDANYNTYFGGGAAHWVCEHKTLDAYHRDRAVNFYHTMLESDPWDGEKEIIDAQAYEQIEPTISIEYSTRPDVTQIETAAPPPLAVRAMTDKQRIEILSSYVEAASAYQSKLLEDSRRLLDERR